MKQLHRTVGLVSLLALLVPLVGACGSSQPSLAGNWAGKYKDESVRMVFDNKGHVTVTIDDMSQEGTYTVNLAAKPATLDLAFADGSKVETIIELTSADTLRMENSSSDEPRPTTFQDYIDLTRQP